MHRRNVYKLLKKVILCIVIVFTAEENATIIEEIMFKITLADFLGPGVVYLKAWLRTAGP